MKMEITLIMPGPFAARKNPTFSGKHTRRIVFLRPFTVLGLVCGILCFHNLKQKVILMFHVVTSINFWNS